MQNGFYLTSAGCEGCGSSGNALAVAFMFAFVLLGAGACLVRRRKAQGAGGSSMGTFGGGGGGNSSNQGAPEGGEKKLTWRERKALKDAGKL